MVIFLDTYAIMEIDIGNPRYRSYALTPDGAITTLLNLIEAHYVYLKKFGAKEAERIYMHVKPIVLPVGDATVQEANTFKLLHLKKRFSFADCIGYATARKYKARFLTGDYMFKGMEGVEFVK